MNEKLSFFRNTPHILLTLFILIFIVHADNPTAAHAQLQTWKKYTNNPIITTPPNAQGASILKEKKTYKMWYSGKSNNTTSIHFAISKDGVKWENAYNDVITPNPQEDLSWTETAVFNPMVISDGTKYQMWYVSSRAGSKNFASGESRYRIQYATSNDGVTWTRIDVALEPIKNSWEAEGIGGPSVLYKNSQYHMWYTGRDRFGIWRIGYATSSNGAKWNKYSNNPVLYVTKDWEFKGGHLPGVGDPSVLFKNNQYYLFYNVGTQVPARRIGYAISQDATTWSKPEDNPLLEIGENGFDSVYLKAPSVIEQDNNLWMYYSGYNGSNWSIGLATSELPSPTPTSIPTPTPKEKDAVIIVPGMFASFEPKAFATCSKTNWQDWKLIPRVTEYNGLIKTLEAAGYILNQDLFIFPYDWRQKITDSGKDLKEFIDNQVSQQNPGKKIDLIGHSLGGLVARSYLQEYDTGLIDQIITVGSPHHGVLEAYRPWAGGELPAEESMQSAVSFITNVCKILTISPTKKDVVHKVAPVFRDLLPIYPPIIFNNSEATYLRDNSTKIFISKKLMADNDLLNTYLPTLNSNFSTHFSSFDGITSSIKQMPLVYDVAVYLEDELLEIYQLGRPSLTPLAKLPTEFGDGTVLKLSATFQNDQFYDLPYDHRGLIYSKKGIEKIVEILDVSPTTIVQGQPTNYKPSILMLLRSPATLTVKDPQGKIVETNTKFVFLPGFVGGQYAIEVTGTDSGSYEFMVGQFTNNDIQWNNYQNITKDNQKDTYMLQFDTKKPVHIPLIDPTAADHILSARQKILNLQKIQDARYLQKALRILDRIEFFINKDFNQLAAYYALRINRYLLFYKRKTDNVEAQNAAINTIRDLEAAYAILAKNAGLDKHMGKSVYSRVSRYADIVQHGFQTQAEKGKESSTKAAVLVEANEKLKKAEEARTENEPFRAEALSWTAFYLLKEAR